MKSRLIPTVTTCLAVPMVAAAALPLIAGAGPSTGGAAVTDSTEPDESSLPAGYRVLVDDTQRITVAVPETWDDIDLAPTILDGIEMPRIHAATDRAAWAESFDASGVLYAAHPYTPDPQTLYDQDYAPRPGCADSENVPYDDGAYKGQWWRHTQCGATGDAQSHVVIASPASQEFTLAVIVQITGPAEEGAFDVILESFNIIAGATWPTTATEPSTTAPVTTTSPASSTSTTATTAPIPDSTIAAQPRQLVDSTNLLTVTIPGDWDDVLTMPGNHDDGSERATLIASTDIDAFLNTFDTPGMRMVAVPAHVLPAVVLANNDFGASCAGSGPEPFNNGRFVGEIQTWTECDNVGRLIQIAARPHDLSFTLFVEIQEVEQLSRATQTVLSTFGVVPGSTFPSVTQTGPSSVGTVSTTLFQGPVQPGAVTILDDGTNISVAVPGDWTDTDGSPSFNDDMTTRPRLVAAPDIDELFDSWTTPGVVITVFPSSDPGVVLDNLGWGDDCDDTGALSFDNGVYSGYLRTWSNCANTSTRIVTLAVSPADSSAVLHVEVQLPDADDTALRTILSSVHLI